MRYHLILLFISTQYLFNCFGQNFNTNEMDSNYCIHGKVFKYYPNGNPKSFKTYHHGFLYGIYEKYYRNGQTKEKGFLDDVNAWTLLFQPIKVAKEKYKKNGELKISLKTQIKPINEVPYGKCRCKGDNIKRIQSLLLGTWVKEKMIPFDKGDKVIDSVYEHYDTKITFFPNDSLSISIGSKQYCGRYHLTTNTLTLEMLQESNNWEALISMRWPKNTLFPNSTQDHFDLELIELLNILDQNGQIKLSNTIVKLKRERQYINEYTD